MPGSSQLSACSPSGRRPFSGSKGSSTSQHYRCGGGKVRPSVLVTGWVTNDDGPSPDDEWGPARRSRLVGGYRGPHALTGLALVPSVRP